MTAIYLLISIMVCFHKADFVNMTCAMIAVYLLAHLNTVRPKYFRALVAGIILSLLVDLLWFWEKYRAYSGDDDDEDGGMERSVRRFSLSMATISFFFKIVMCIIYWKASIDLVKAKDEERAALLKEVDDVV